MTRTTIRGWLAGALLVAGLVGALKIAEGSGESAVDGWPYYGHDAGGMRYSPLTQINRNNVSNLKVAWTFHTGEISDGSGRRKRSGFETTPLVVDGTLYLTTPFNRVIALDPETGAQRWGYDPKIELDADYGDGLVNRGAATWLDSARGIGPACRRRIFEATQDARLIALDAVTGAPCSDFGKGGQVTLRDVAGYHAGWYHMTSPPAVIDDLVVVGSAIDDNHRADMARGVVRAYDARSGALRWSWDPIPSNVASSADGSGKSWRSGAANAWSIMVVDAERDLIFVPTGSASPDYYGGLRPGDDKWANSVVALRAKTGEVVWGFQLVHHDLWDFDSASPPLLTNVRHDAQDIPVVIQGNKSGLLYVLNRDTGKPVFPVEERPVPKSDVPGEVASATQPFPVAPPPLAAHHLSADEAYGPSDADREFCRKAISELRNEGIFTPPSLKGSLMVPGNVGGMTWSGYAFDPQRGLLVTNTNNLVAWVRLTPRAIYDKPRSHDQENADHGDQTGTPYGMARNFLQSPSDLPCSAPPWGVLTAVDMAEGKIRWQVPLGSMQNFGGEHAQKIPPGSISLGGAIITAGGLVFIAGTTDGYLRAFDIENGAELWKAQLPAGANATPMTYRVSANGKQYLVVAAGGHPKIREEEQSDALVAFALP